MINIHHLELFYYVARHGGIMQAVRNMPYGIQQPAVSGQILQLEEYLGGPLFQRRPFQLSQAGEELYAFIEPFFNGVDAVVDRVRGGAIQTLRVAASAVVLRDHLPEMLPEIRRRFPNLRLTLREGVQPQIVEWLQSGEVDLAVTVLDGKLPAGIKGENLIELPLALLVPKALKVKSVVALLAQDRMAQTLISLPNNEALARVFQEELARRKVDWPVGMEVNSLDLVEIYAGSGFGVGLTVAIPGKAAPKNVQVFPLEDFPRITLCAMWQGKAGVVAAALVALFQKRAEAVRAA